MTISNYSVPNEEQMKEMEGRYFIPQEITDQIAYAAGRGREAFDRITGRANVGAGSNSEQIDTKQPDKKPANIGKTLFYTGGLLILATAVYFGVQYYNKANKK